MIPTNELKLRPATIADLEAMRIIGRLPEIRKNQYWIEEAIWLDFAEKTIRGEEPEKTKLDVIDVKGKVSGYVITRLQVHNNGKFGYLSFNLLPEFWGRGLMAIALETIITDLFQNDHVEGVMVECFSGNHQCRRLLQKLSFKRVSIPVLERLICLATRLPIRWVLRYWLTRPVSQNVSLD